MNSVSEFFLEFLTPFFKGFVDIFVSLFKGLLQMFNVFNYISIINKHKSNLTGGKVFIVILAIICLLLLVAILVFVIVKIIKRFIRIRKRSHEQELLLEEVENLNYENIKLKKENEKYAAMANGEKVVGEDGNPVESNSEENVEDDDIRFYKLCTIDEEWKDYQPEATDNTIKLNELCERFRNFAASSLGLYYNINLIRLFVSAFASNRLIILQGISGTGKTSLAYAFGKFLNNESVITSVQPSWRDRTELFGYFNEFTKKFNETELLSKMYEASYNNKVYVTILDEMNIARVEYYFAEMLSIMELPSFDEWVVDLVPNPWPTDPKKLVNGKFTIPRNMWYVGTINNDDSTFMVTDKVYDRALPIAIDEKAPSFEAPKTEGIHISTEYFMKLFSDAWKDKPISEETLNKITAMDDYIIEHFRISFGNRILQQMKHFVPVYVASGGEEIDAVDYLICHKILRKFEQLNMSYIRNEVDAFIDFLNRTFGENVMKECINYLTNLKKNA